MSSVRFIAIQFDSEWLSGRPRARPPSQTETYQQLPTMPICCCTALVNGIRVIKNAYNILIIWIKILVYSYWNCIGWNISYVIADKKWTRILGSTFPCSSMCVCARARVQLVWTVTLNNHDNNNVTIMCHVSRSCTQEFVPCVYVNYI